MLFVLSKLVYIYKLCSSNMDIHDRYEFTVSSPDAAQITVGTCFHFVKATGLKNDDCDNINLFLTHWGWVMHICVGNLTIIGSDNGLPPGRRGAIICTNVVMLLIRRPLGTNFNEIVI